MDSITPLFSMALTIAGMFAGAIIYTIRQEGRLNLLRKDLSHAKEYIDHLIEEGKNFKLVQGGYENTQNGMKVSIARIEEKQDSTIEKIADLKTDMGEIKKLLKAS